MKVGDLVKKRGRRGDHDQVMVSPRILSAPKESLDRLLLAGERAMTALHKHGIKLKADHIFGVVVEVEGSHCRVNFGDYGTFWQSLQQIEFLS